MSAVTAGTGTLLLGKTALAFSPGTSLAGTDPYQIVTLGKSGLRTTLLGMGTGYSGYNKSSSITRAGRDTAIGLIRYAYESGIRFFDCADAYGTHPYTMEALKNFPRESYTLCSKILVSRSGVISPENPGADVLIDRFRKELIETYGEKHGKAVQTAEAFELCEYGRQPSAAELKKLFPFFEQ